MLVRRIRTLLKNEMVETLCSTKNLDGHGTRKCYNFWVIYFQQSYWFSAIWKDPGVYDL